MLSILSASVASCLLMLKYRTSSFATLAVAH